MPTLLSFDTPPNNFMLALIGPAGCGKTTLVTRFPKTFIIDLDHNLAGPVKVAKKENRILTTSFDVIDQKTTTAEPTPKEMLDRLMKLLNEFVASPDYDTCVIDSTTVLSEIVQRFIMAGQSQMTIAMWGQYLSWWKQLLMRLRTAKKNFIFCGHLTEVFDEKGNIEKHLLSLPGKIANELPALCTDVWRVFTKSKLNQTTQQQVITYHISTQQSPKFPNFKSSLDIDGEYEANQATVNLALGIK